MENWSIQMPQMFTPSFFRRDVQPPQHTNPAMSPVSIAQRSSSGENSVDSDSGKEGGLSQIQIPEHSPENDEKRDDKARKAAKYLKLIAHCQVSTPPGQWFRCIYHIFHILFFVLVSVSMSLSFPLSDNNNLTTTLPSLLYLNTYSGAMASAIPLSAKTLVSCWTTARPVWTARNAPSRAASRPRSCCVIWSHVASSASKRGRQALSPSTATSALPWKAAKTTTGCRTITAVPRTKDPRWMWMEPSRGQPCCLAASDHPHREIWVIIRWQQQGEEEEEETGSTQAISVEWVLSPWRRSRRRWRWRWRRAWRTRSAADASRYDRVVFAIIAYILCCLSGTCWLLDMLCPCHAPASLHI